MLHTVYICILLCAAESHAFYDKCPDVVELTPSNFYRLVTNSDDIWIVEFFFPWCPHCEKLAPEYMKAAKALKGIVKVGAIDAAEHTSLVDKYGVVKVPTLKIFSGSKHTPYKGNRTAEDLIEAAINAVKNKAYANIENNTTSSDTRSYKLNINKFHSLLDLLPCRRIDQG